MPDYRHPTWNQELNAIVDIAENTCGINWAGRISLAAEPLADELIMLITPSPLQVLEEYLDPKATRGSRYGPRGRRRQRRDRRDHRRRRRHRIGLPDPDDVVADRLPGREFFNTRKIGATEFLFWTGLNAADRVQWYWLLISSIGDFFYNWHSNIVESTACLKPFDTMGQLLCEYNPAGGLLEPPPNKDDWTIIDGYGWHEEITSAVILDQPANINWQWQGTWTAANTTPAGVVTFQCIIDRYGHPQTLVEQNVPFQPGQTIAFGIGGFETLAFRLTFHAPNQTSTAATGNCGWYGHYSDVPT